MKGKVLSKNFSSKNIFKTLTNPTKQEHYACMIQPNRTKEMEKEKRREKLV